MTSSTSITQHGSKWWQYRREMTVEEQGSILFLCKTHCAMTKEVWQPTILHLLCSGTYEYLSLRCFPTMIVTREAYFCAHSMLKVKEVFFNLCETRVIFVLQIVCPWHYGGTYEHFIWSQVKTGRHVGFQINTWEKLLGIEFNFVNWINQLYSIGCTTPQSIAKVISSSGRSGQI